MSTHLWSIPRQLNTLGCNHLLEYVEELGHDDIQPPLCMLRPRTI